MSKLFKNEEYPDGYTGMPFLTAVQSKGLTEVVIVDNVIGKNVRVYIIDLHAPESIEIESILQIAAEWFERDSDNHPISIEFAKRNVLPQTERLLKVLNLDSLDRIIGPMFHYEIGKNSTNPTKRRKRQVPSMQQ